MKTVILGAGGNGTVFLDTFRDFAGERTVEVIGFIDDNLELEGREVLGIPVLGTYTQLPELIKRHNIKGVSVAYSDRLMRLREERFNQCRELGLKPINIVHPSAMISSAASIGEGVLIGKAVIIEPGVKIGDNCAIHRGSTVGEFTVLEENVFLTGGINLAAFVTVEKNVMFGTGANVIARCHIARDVIVGAGAVVINDIPAGVTVVGVPARIIKEREQDANSI